MFSLHVKNTDYILIGTGQHSVNECTLCCPVPIK